MPRTASATKTRPVSVPTVQSQPVPEPTKYIAFILDKSGSMGTIKQATIDGFNEYLQGLQASDDAPNVLLTLVQFDSLGTERSRTLPVLEVVPLDHESYQPRASTPLYDAVVETVEALHSEVSKRPDRVAVQVVIMTDGYENASRNHTQSCLQELVALLENGGKGDWTFVYMGANQDAWALASQWGLSQGNTHSWQPTSQGAHVTFRNIADGTVNYFSAVNTASQTGASYAYNATLGASTSSVPTTPIPPMPTETTMPRSHTHLKGHPHAAPPSE